MHRRVVVCGGGAMGTSSAYWLKLKDPGMSVTVLEQDPSYSKASTPLAVGGVRFQFSNRENIEMCKFSSNFFQNVNQHLRVDEDIDLNYHQKGYSFLLSSETVYGSESVLQTNVSLQRECGCPVSIAKLDEMMAMYPFLNPEGLHGCTYAELEAGEGWLDPALMLQAFKRKAQSIGVKYAKACATNFDVHNDKVTAVYTKDGVKHECDDVVMATGRHSHMMASILGVGDDIQVVPRKRYVHLVSCPNFVVKRSLAQLKSATAPHRPFPLLIDPTGYFVRPEGQQFVVGSSPHGEDADPDVDFDDFTIGEEANNDWYDHIWPNLATRIPAFEEARLTSTYVGHYDFNKKDQNAIIGKVPGAHSNVVWITGFSGHGMQQCPAAGRAVSELVLTDQFQTINLTRMHPKRDDLLEKNIV
eukprot:PhM_4_TR11540/c0_g1_i1/m.38015/K18166/FOXRED1; FAD-dependent oxidoreductase domain-containing protein 1